jgi:hypothetical protein
LKTRSVIFFQVGEPKKPLVESINPVTGRPLWHWHDDGYRRPGSKGKAKKLFHRAIERGAEILNVGDCAVFLSTARVDRPYIGQVSMLQTVIIVKELVL